MRYKILFIIVVFISLFACRKEKFVNVLIFGHAGNGLNIQNSVYHDNSKEAINFALSMEGTNGVEVDLQLSKDGKLWLFHDNTLDKETNFSGCINDYTSSELKKCYYSTSKKEAVIAFSELDFINYSSSIFILDIRHYRGCNLDLIDTAIFIQQLIQLKSNHPSIHFLISTNYQGWVSSIEAKGFEVFFEINSYNDVQSFPFANNYIVKNENISNDEVHSIQSNNKKVLIFEVRSPKFIRKALKKLPYGVITDDLKATIIEKY